MKELISNKDKKGLLQIWCSLFAVEVFAYCFLKPAVGAFHLFQLSPLVFGAVWASLVTLVLYSLPNAVSKWAFFLLYWFIAVYAGFQTGYYVLFSEMMWLSEFRYASEGSDYASVLFSYPIGWWIGVLLMIGIGLYHLWRFPLWQNVKKYRRGKVLIILFLIVTLFLLPKILYLQDQDYEQRSDYKRAESVEAAYENMFNVLRLYRICGLYQTAAKDIYHNEIYPKTPGYVLEQQKNCLEIEEYLSHREKAERNAVTGILSGKNVILILMESLDDWMIGEHTPAIQYLMNNGINFTNVYTPLYGGIRTFNTEFCINTGSFLSSQGGYAFDYITNAYPQSLPNLLRNLGYSAMTFHFNGPDFYSRGEFSPVIGYDRYVYYAEYLNWDTEENSQISSAALDSDDLVLFDYDGLNDLFFRKDGPKLNFVITNAAHLPYTYDNAGSQFGFQKHPEFFGATGNEEQDCAFVKAKLLDDFYQRLLQELESHGELDNTVIIGITDHYTYGYNDTEALLKLSKVEEKILLEKTPCFIWSADLQAMEVDKVLNTSDLLPTMLNLLGVESPYDYIGHDAFDINYEGFVPFSNGSWICGDTAYDSGTKEYISISGNRQTVTADFQKEMAEAVQEFIRINNLILDADYYRS